MADAEANGGVATTALPAISYRQDKNFISPKIHPCQHIYLFVIPFLSQNNPKIQIHLLTLCILVDSYNVMLDESIYHFRGVWSVLLLLFYFCWKILLANNVDPDQMPHYMASDLGLHCLPMTLLWVSR